MTDEEIIRRKLIFDGEGTGDDRRINVLQRMIIKWINTNYESQKENEAEYKKILLLMDNIEHSRHKSELVKKCHEKELNMYRSYQNEMKNNVASINKVLDISKALLADIKSENHQKLKYNMIAKDIEVQPSRKGTSKRIAKLEQNISNLKISKKKVTDDWLKWQKRFDVIVNSANNLSTMLDE